MTIMNTNQHQIAALAYCLSGCFHGAMNRANPRGPAPVEHVCLCRVYTFYRRFTVKTFAPQNYSRQLSPLMYAAHRLTRNYDVTMTHSLAHRAGPFHLTRRLKQRWLVQNNRLRPWRRSPVSPHVFCASLAQRGRAGGGD